MSFLLTLPLLGASGCSQAKRALMDIRELYLVRDTGRIRTNMVCELTQPVFEDYWPTPQAIRTLVLELPPGFQASTSCSLVDCLRTEQFFSPADPEPARRYFPLSISSMGSWTTRKTAFTSASTKTNSTSLRKCSTSVGTFRTLRITRN